MLKRTRDIIWQKYHRYAIFYDLDDLIFFGTKQKLRKRVMALAKVKEGKLVLDLMVGTAESTLLAARAGGRVVSADFSRSMLNIADRKITKEGLKNISLVMGNGENLPFPDNTFDAVFCTFGLDVAYNPELVVFEMIRVAKERVPIVAAHKSFPRNKIISIFDNLVEMYLDLFWRCRNVELNSIFKKAGMIDIKEESYYCDMGKVIVGRKRKKTTANRSDP
jgi:ubiquinone/menaquinone biosynthesis C-methylase UbiE